MMKKYIPYILTIGIVLFVVGEVFPQSGDGDGYVRGFTAARVRALGGAVVGLVSLIMAWRAMRRSTSDPVTARPTAIRALVLGLIAVVFSTIHLATTPGGLGTGGGKAGAIGALGLGLIGSALSALTLMRSKKA